MEALALREGCGVNDSDTLTLVAAAITDCATDPLHAVIEAWLTSIAARGVGVSDVDRDYALVTARTYLYGEHA